MGKRLVRRRNTNRKAIINALLDDSAHDFPYLLSEIRALAHRREQNPRKYNDFKINESDESAFNRTIRQIGDRARSFAPAMQVHTWPAGLAAKAIISQAMHRGRLRRFPLEQIQVLFFNEHYRIDVPSYKYALWWLSGLVARQSGSTLAVISIPITASLKLIYKRHPTWDDMMRAAQVPWKLFELTGDGFKAVAPTARLGQPVLKHCRDYSLLQLSGYRLNRRRVCPPRQILFPPGRHPMTHTNSGWGKWDGLHRLPSGKPRERIKLQQPDWSTHTGQH